MLNNTLLIVAGAAAVLGVGATAVLAVAEPSKGYCVAYYEGPKVGPPAKTDGPYKTVWDAQSASETHNTRVFFCEGKREIRPLTQDEVASLDYDPVR